MRKLSVFVAMTFLSGWSGADSHVESSCVPHLVATEFTGRGATTITLDQDKQLTHWYDGFRWLEGGEKELHLTRDRRAFYLSRGFPKAFDLSVDWTGETLAVLMDSAGLYLVTPESWHYEIAQPGKGLISAISFWRPNVGDSDRDGCGEFRFLYAANGRTIVRLPMRSCAVNQDLKEGSFGFVRRGENFEELSLPLRRTGLPLMESVYLRSGRRTALEVGSWQVTGVVDSKRLDKIDFLQVLGEREFVIASERGKIYWVSNFDTFQEINIPTKEKWIRSITAYRMGENVHISALSAADPTVMYWWDSTQETKHMQTIPTPLSAGTDQALQLFSRAAPFQADSPFVEEPGFFTLSRWMNEKGYLARILLVASHDGGPRQLYGFTGKSWEPFLSPDEAP